MAGSVEAARLQDVVSQLEPSEPRQTRHQTRRARHRHSHGTTSSFRGGESGKELGLAF